MELTPKAKKRVVETAKAIVAQPAKADKFVRKFLRIYLRGENIAAAKMHHHICNSIMTTSEKKPNAAEFKNYVEKLLTGCWFAIRESKLPESQRSRIVRDENKPNIQPSS